MILIPGCRTLGNHHEKDIDGAKSSLGRLIRRQDSPVPLVVRAFVAIVETQGGRDEAVRGAGLRKNQSPHPETYEGLWSDVFSEGDKS